MTTIPDEEGKQALLSVMEEAITKAARSLRQKRR